jgi:hypothetical protein
VNQYFPNVKEYDLIYDGSYDACHIVHDAFKALIKKCLFKFKQEVSVQFELRFTQVQPNGSMERKSILQLSSGNAVYVIIGVGKTGNGAHSFLSNINNCLCGAQIKHVKPHADSEYIALLRKDLEESAKHDKSITPETINYLISNIQW